MQGINAKITPVIIKYWPCFLILLAFIGFISKSLYNYPVGLMAVIGLFKITASPTKIFKDQILKIFTIVFLVIWIPMLISYPDAVNKEHAVHTIIPYLRFYFAGVFIIEEIAKDADRLKFILVSVFYIVFFWTIDATIQFIFGQNLLGFPYEGGHITGMFYPRNTISHVCAILSGLCFLYIYLQLNKNKWLLISLIPLFFILLLSGRRAAWVMLALSLSGFLVYAYFYTARRKLFLKITTIMTIIITLLLSVTILFHPPTNDRFKVTLGLFSSDYETINKATAIRLPIWEVAYSIFKANPVNGIGPRGFRHAYRDYAKPDDYFVSVDDIPTQPHILFLEILAETGIVGFSGYLLLIYFVVSIVIQSNNRRVLFPFLIPVLVAIFPFNAHMAFYGSIWSSMIWLLLSLYFTCAKLILDNKAPAYDN
ncbi:MAG: O-antigen ligase family protein [Proteobacteria bacterium]|nr:O-antigen ligase family protein [Pseudomonadota bacterium]